MDYVILLHKFSIIEGSNMVTLEKLEKKSVCHGDKIIISEYDVNSVFGAPRTSIDYIEIKIYDIYVKYYYIKDIDLNSTDKNIAFVIRNIDPKNYELNNFSGNIRVANFKGMNFELKKKYRKFLKGVSALELSLNKIKKSSRIDTKIKFDGWLLNEIKKIPSKKLKGVLKKYSKYSK